jgi:signal transduction histidine kinase
VATEELSKKIQDQEELRKRLTSDVAHELRTPLATLQSHLEAMIDGIWEPTPQRLSFCYDELIRLTRLISDLNELSIIESDKIQLKIKELELSQLLNDTLENFRPLFLEKSIILHRQIEKEVRFKGDNDRLKQIFVNILSNAYKYTPENGEVTVRLTVTPGKLMIEVKDTGIGISKEDLPYIFERFYRGDKSRNRESGGAGIGLTITKALVEAHGGVLQVDSVYGSGTTVSVILPKE